MNLGIYLCTSATRPVGYQISEYEISEYEISEYDISEYDISEYEIHMPKSFFFLEMILLTVLLQYLQDGTGSSSKIPTLGSPEKKRRRLMQLMLVVSLRTSFLRRGFLVTSYEVWI